jgi:FtsZ-interacting cell division protein ZipA
MNWKHFLRGLGAGIIFTALIMLVAYMTSGSYRISDEEVITRAKKLGMVMEDKTIVADADSQEDTEEENSSDTAEVTEKTEASTTEMATSEASTTEKATTEKVTTEATTEKATTEKATTEKATTEKATTEKATTEKTTTEKTTTEKATTEKTTTEEKINTQYITAEITVTSGMGSEEIAKMVQDAGIIDDYRDFDNYLNNNGYSKRLSVNTFNLNSGMSYEEIAKELTKGDR